MCTGGGESRTLLTVPKSRIASQGTLFETVTIDAELNWNLQVADVIATTRDGPQVQTYCVPAASASGLENVHSLRARMPRR